MFLKQWRADLVALLFPNLCNGCGTPLFNSEHLICSKCIYDLPFTDYHTYAENRVAKQLWARVPLNAAMALLYFRKAGKVQNLIHHLKYKNQTEIGVILGKKLGERIKTSPLYAGIDLIIPVPLHPKKFKIRGYNQSKFIAEGISEALSIPFDEQSLLRVKSTESQTKKSRYSRYENMREVFKAFDNNTIANKHILLVDDVLTTGATLEACVLQLLENGAKKVSIATLAYAE
jgi:ComF family protein